MTAPISAPRPGQKAQLSPEGIILGTDGKRRWVYRTSLWQDTDKLLRLLTQYTTVGFALGVLTMLGRTGGGISAVLAGLPLLLGLTAAGALVAVLLFAGGVLSAGGSCCVLFTMDDTAICRQQIRGRVDKQKAEAVIISWVGGQSQPHLRFYPPKEIRPSQIRTVRFRPEREQILLRGGGKLRVQGDSAQLGAVLTHLQTACPAADIKH